MIIAVIDSGTTNTRVSLVDHAGALMAHATRPVGVRDTAIAHGTGPLRHGIREAYNEVVAHCGAHVDLAIAAGMLTSELGLVELPHLDAPVDSRGLAEGMELVTDASISGLPIPVYFIRGIRNTFDPATIDLAHANALDFMRGEEAQVVGLLAEPDVKPPLVFTMLSSHTKLVAVNKYGAITGSLTTISGQIYAALLHATSLAKSLEGANDEIDFEEHRDVAAAAIGVSRDAGFLRAIMMTRFLDTLMETTADQRRLYVEAAIAAEDCRCIAAEHAAEGHIRALVASGQPVYLIGSERRVKLYDYAMREMLSPRPDTRLVYERARVDGLAIRGMLALLHFAGVIEEE